MTENSSKRPECCCIFSAKKCCPVLIVLSLYSVLFVFVSVVFWQLENTQTHRNDRLLAFLNVYKNFSKENSCVNDEKTINFINNVFSSFLIKPPYNFTNVLVNRSANASFTQLATKKNSAISLTESFIFSASIFTTIGYGNTTPTSPWAKMLTILVSLLSIPVTYILLTAVAHNLLSCLSHLISTRRCASSKSPDLINQDKARILSNGSTTSPAEDTPLKKDQKLSSSDKFYSATDDEHASKSDSFKSDSDAVVERMEEKLVASESKETSITKCKPDSDVDMNLCNRPLNVFLLSVTTIVLVILLPGLLFMCMENWSFLDSVYFCITTVTTVGFGDYVPGRDNDDKISTLFYHIFIVVYLFGAVVVTLAYVESLRTNRSIQKLVNWMSPPVQNEIIETTNK